MDFPQYCYYPIIGEEDKVLCGICALGYVFVDVEKSFLSPEFPADKCDNRKNHGRIPILTERGTITNAATFTLEEKYRVR